MHFQELFCHHTIPNKYLRVKSTLETPGESEVNISPKKLNPQYFPWSLPTYNSLMWWGQTLKVLLLYCDAETSSEYYGRRRIWRTFYKWHHRALMHRAQNDFLEKYSKHEWVIDFKTLCGPWLVVLFTEYSISYLNVPLYFVNKLYININTRKRSKQW